MKKTISIIVILTVMFSANAISATSFENGEVIEWQALEPGKTDPRAVQIEEEVVPHINNGELEDRGDIFISWSKNIIVKYGCDLAEIEYTNPGKSNIGVKIDLILYDHQVYSYFGTTFRSEEEQNALALTGLYTLRNGVQNIGFMDRLLAKGIISTDQYEYPVPRESFIDILVENDYLGYSKEQWQELDEDKIFQLPEYEKLMIAQLGDYKFKFGHFLSLGETGLLPQGYAINKIQLHTFGENYTLPAGEYNIQFRILAYDVLKGEYSKFGSTVPVTLHVERNLPKKLQEEYDIKIAKRIDR